MHIEVICTGDELLTGLTADTNSPYFMGKVLQLGEQVRRSRVVGDVRDDIREALLEASTRCDVVLVSGGLGPTADDLTAECAAQAAGVKLVEHAGVRENLEQRFAKRGIRLSANNLRQALVPEGAEVVVSPVGSAPMFSLTLGRCTFFFVAGVPREYRYLVDHEILPRIEKRLASEPGRLHRAFALLRTVNLPESHLDAKVSEFRNRHPLINFGFRTQAPENHLKLLAEAPTQAEADAALAAAKRDSLDALGAFYFGEGDEDLPAFVARNLRERGLSVAVAESCTGGVLSKLLTRDAGASAFFQGGAVVYQDARKREWAHVPAALLEEKGAVSEDVAAALASGIREALHTDVGLGVTGFAGPDGGTDELPVGTVFVSVCLRGRAPVVERFRFGNLRDRVQHFAAYAALDLLRREALASTAPLEKKPA